MPEIWISNYRIDGVAHAMKYAGLLFCKNILVGFFTGY
jgi:hypothetical protein